MTEPVIQDGTVYYPGMVRIRTGALEQIVHALTTKDGFMRGGLPRVYVYDTKLIIELPCNVGKAGDIVSVDVSLDITSLLPKVENEPTPST
jgi:hypothetical protein